jgi:hypothetical protein
MTHAAPLIPHPVALMNRFSLSENCGIAIARPSYAKTSATQETCFHQPFQTKAQRRSHCRSTEPGPGRIPGQSRSALAKASKALSVSGEQVFPTFDARNRPCAYRFTPISGS